MSSALFNSSNYATKNNEKIVLALSVIVELTELKGAQKINIPVYSEIKY